MTLRTRFLLHGAAVVAGLICIGLYTEAQLDSITQRRRALREEWVELDRALALESLASSASWAAERGDAAQAADTIGRLRRELEDLAAYQRRQRGPLAQEYQDSEIDILTDVMRLVDRLQAASDSRSLEAIRAAHREIGAAMDQFHGIAEEEMREAIDGIQGTETLLDRLMWIWLGALLLVLGAGALMVHRHVTRPLRALRQGAQALRSRDFAHRVPIARADEIGDVAQTFNAVSAELGTLYQSLEDKVAAQAEEIRQSVAELERSMRLATIGTLAAGVAHEINNPLEAIGVRAEGMRRRAVGDDIRDGLDLVTTEVRRCQEITQRLLTFARQRRGATGASLTERVDVAAVVRDAAELVRLRGTQHTPFDIQSDGAPVWTLGDPTALRQVFLNLLLNAAEATERGGSVTVSTTRESSRIRVEVHDTGQGIDSADLPHLFDPFYTTKEGKGTGLGLSVSLGIILDHGGTITIDSAGPGCGATVTATLPAAREAPNVR